MTSRGYAPKPRNLKRDDYNPEIIVIYNYCICQQTDKLILYCDPRRNVTGECQLLIQFGRKNYYALLMFP